MNKVKNRTALIKMAASFAILTIWAVASVSGSTITVGGKIFTIVESSQEECQVTPTPAQTTAGVIPYVRIDPAVYVQPLSAPQAGEVLDEINMSAARDEYESLRIMVYGLRNVSDFFIKYQATASVTASILTSDWVELAQIPFRYQRLSYESTYVRKTAKIIFPITSDLRFTVSNGNTRVFYLTVKVPSTAQSGKYSGQLVLGAESATPLTIPLNLCVRSFDLVAPEQKIGFTSESTQPLNDVYAHMFKYGFKASTLTMSSLNLVQDDSGKWVLDSSDIITMVQQYLNAGMSPPIPLEICRLSTKLSQKLGLYDGMDKDPVTDASDMICPATEDDYPESLQEAYAYAIGALWKDLKSAGIEGAVALYPIDEPTANYHRMPMAKVQTRLIRQAAPDAKIYVTVHDVDRTEELIQGGALDIAGVVLSYLVQNNKDWQSLADTCNISLYAYGGAPGLRTEGFMVAGNNIDRLLLWPSYIAVCDADDVYNDMRASVAAEGYFLPSDTGYKNTLDFELVREGLDDLRYWATAEQYIKEKELSTNTLDQEKAVLAKQKLESLKKTFSRNVNLTASQCSIARDILADIISEVSPDSTVDTNFDGSFEVTAPASMFTSWALAAGATIGGDSGAAFATYNTTYTNNTTINGCDTPNSSAWLTIPFKFSSPLVNASIEFNSEMRGYDNNWGASIIYVIVDGVETKVYAHASPDYVTSRGMNASDVYYNFNGDVPSGSGIFCTSTNITSLVQGKTSFSIKFVSTLGWSNWVYNGGVFMASDADSPDFKLTGNVVTYIAGDANGDGAVNVSDLSLLAANYGTTSNATWAMGDFNVDGAVNVSDLSLLAANYGTGATSTLSWADAYNQVFGTTTVSDGTIDDTDTGESSLCSSLGLSLVVGMVLLGLSLTKLEE